VIGDMPSTPAEAERRRERARPRIILGRTNGLSPHDRSNPGARPPEFGTFALSDQSMAGGAREAASARTRDASGSSGRASRRGMGLKDGTSRNWRAGDERKSWWKQARQDSSCSKTPGKRPWVSPAGLRSRANVPELLRPSETRSAIGLRW